MPVRLAVKGHEVTGSWGMDVMVAPERQRQGLGEVLFRTWDRNVGASLGLGLSDASYRLFQKLRWPDVGPVPCLVKPLTRRAFRHPRWPTPINRLISALTLPIVLIVSRARPLRAEVRLIRRFDDSFTELWDALAPKFDLAVRRDAAYLNWKFATAPHVRYTMAALRARRRRPRATPSTGTCTSRAGASRCSSTSSPILTTRKASRRCCAGSTGKRGRPTPTRSARSPCTPVFRRLLRRSGYFQVKSTMEFVVKVNGIDVAPSSTRTPTDGTSRWATRTRTDEEPQITRC